MTVPPKLVRSGPVEGQAPGVQYRVEGELVPVLHLNLDGSVPVYFEHHIILWRHPDLGIGIRPMKDVLKRMVAGIQVFVTQTNGVGQIAFSRDGTGEILPIHLHPGQAIVVREHQFLCATNNVDYTFNRVKGIGNMLVGGTGFFVDHFHGTNGEGVVWLHAYGNFFEKVLEPGEVIDVEPGGWVYTDESVTMQQTVVGLKTGIFAGSGNLVFNRFTGPGRVGIQSMSFHLPTAE